MKIMITGATGLVGTRLLEKLVLSGYEDIRVLTQNKEKAKKIIPFPVTFFSWSPEKDTIEAGALEDVNVILHLAGENISDGRWNEAKKKRILDSREKSTALLIKEIKKLKTPPQKFISSSAVGIYGCTTDEIINEDHKHGDDFLARVCKTWESTLLESSIKEMSIHCIRTGVVLASHGGALTKMLPAFLAGISGKLGSGTQYMSWIHIDDLVNQFIFLIENNGQFKSYNGTSPMPVTNNEFTKALGKTINRPTIFPVPALALQTLFGEMSEILLKGQRAVPRNFISEGFKFQFPNIQEALSDLLKHTKNGESVLKKYQWINVSTPDVFEFFSSENNLEKITPPYLQFKVVGKNTEKIEAGTLIDYKLKIHGIPLKWKTKITHFVVNKSFTDVQLSGPYSKWEHQHDFITYKNGTLIKDEVVYKVPMGFLGKITAGPFVNHDVQNIFKFRSQIIKDNFKI